MNQIMKRLVILKILALTMVGPMDAGATMITEKNNSGTDQTAQTRKAAPSPTTRRTFSSVVESDISGQQKQPNSWAARVTKPNEPKRRYKASLEAITAKIASDNAPKDGDDDWNTRRDSTKIEDQGWAIPMPSAHTTKAKNGRIQMPLPEPLDFRGLATNTQWLLSATSNYVQDINQNVQFTVAGPASERLKPARPVVKTTTKPHKSGRTYLAYIVLIVITAGLICLVTRRHGT